MKVTVFRVQSPLSTNPNHLLSTVPTLLYTVPILPAYAVQDSKLELDYILSDFNERSPRHEIRGNQVEAFVGGLGFDSTPRSGFLTVYHSGIKNYSLLFPHIENDLLRVRLGQLAQEAESAFESRSWMSYVVMVGAILEGLLIAHFDFKGFAKLISKAQKAEIITLEERVIFDEVRDMRNRVHPDRYEEQFADREIALELSVIYDKMLKRIWEKS